jgi:ubiquinone/menaquinone biosynthesis C-methylase UbiE
VTNGDHWSQWLLERRDAGDERQRAVTLEQGITLLDLGTGDGLIGLAALARVGASGTAIFSEVSDALLGHVQDAVRERGGLARARFVREDAAELASIADGTVHVVTA